MREKRKAIITTAKKMGKKKRIPQHILEAFFHVIICKMEGTVNPIKEKYDIHLKTAIRAQQTIGLDMMMRGFVAHKRIEALIQQGVPSPERKMNALQEIVWIEIVVPLWFERNDIKHEKAGANDEREAEILNNRIR